MIMKCEICKEEKFGDIRTLRFFNILFSNCSNLLIKILVPKYVPTAAPNPVNNPLMDKPIKVSMLSILLIFPPFFLIF